MKFDFDVIVIGGGAAGLTSSGMAASFGAKTLMVESDKLGGDCTWHGCIPSKSLLHIASDIWKAKSSAAYFDTSYDPKVDFSKVIEKVHTIRERVYDEADRPEIYQSLGVEVQFGLATFVDAHTIQISKEGSTKTISSRYFVIATGSKPSIPPIPGLSDVPYLTNESIFELETQPEHLVIIGAGPIGCELAQAFCRLGTRVTVIDMADRILPRDDEKAAQILRDQLEKEGVVFELGAEITSIQRLDNSIETILNQKPTQRKITGSHLLIATGRTANTASLALEKAGVKTSKGAIPVDKKCRTNISHIYAAGDVSGRPAFTHVAELMAKTAITNMLLKIPKSLDTNTIPWVTYTDPEIGSVGRSEVSLRESGVRFKTYTFPYTKVDRALAEDKTAGLISVFARPFDGKIYGASVVGASAGELLGELSLAISNKISLRKIADTVHAYPTYSLGVRRAADQWYVQKQSLLLVKVLKRLFGYRGALPDLSDPDRIV